MVVKPTICSLLKMAMTAVDRLAICVWDRAWKFASVMAAMLAVEKLVLSSPTSVVDMAAICAVVKAAICVLLKALS